MSRYSSLIFLTRSEMKAGVFCDCLGKMGIIVGWLKTNADCDRIKVMEIATGKIYHLNPSYLHRWRGEVVS